MTFAGDCGCESSSKGIDDLITGLARYWCRACHEFRHEHGPDPKVQMSWRELQERIKRLSG